ncbi:MAG: hypothetical protein LBN95_10005 [Prevotellaceae bacterium]|jgi:hypothetical protein|nr:hypothetical protein [Prevotellaceae bacterium]
MNTVIAYPTTANQITLLETFLKELKIRFAIKKTNETDPTLYSKDAYFAMIDDSIKSAEQGNVYQMKEGQGVKEFLRELCIN